METQCMCVQVLATAKASADAGCDVTILGLVATGDKDDPNVVSCEITAVGKDDNIMQDAVAKAVAEASAYACDSKADAQIELAATVRPPDTLKLPLALFRGFKHVVVLQTNACPDLATDRSTRCLYLSISFASCKFDYLSMRAGDCER